jgi:hypothetical protein
MSLSQRRLIFLAFTLLFLMIAPIALLYATGRTINWQEFEIQKTGSIIVESIPHNADIFLNNTRPNLFVDQILKKNSTPKTDTRITNLTPGNYTIKLILSGYHEWERRTTINENEVTHIGPIHLFKKSKPELFSSLEKDQPLFISPDKKTVLSLNAQTITILQVPEKIQHQLKITDQKYPVIHWSNDNANFILNDSYVISRNGELLANLTQKLNISPSFVRWDNKNNDRIFYIEKNQLKKYNFTSTQKEVVKDLSSILKMGELDDYKPSDSYLYFVIKKAEISEIKIIELNSPHREADTPLERGTYHFISDYRDQILLKNIHKNIVYLLEQPLPLFFTPRLSLVATDYAHGRWESNELIYTTPFEIRSWRNNQATLISRFGETITDLAKIQKNNEIIFTTSHNINVIPLSEQPFGQTVTLLDSVQISSLLLVNSDILYFIGEVDGNYGVYTLEY